MENKIIINEIDCKENKCLLNMWSETCKAICEVENGYCVYEEIEFLRKCKFEDYIERSFPGENFEEKFSNYCYDLFELEENLGSSYELDDTDEYYDDYDDLRFFHDWHEIEFNRYNSILFLQPSDENYDTIYAVNCDNHEIYISAKHAASFIQVWECIKPFIKGCKESKFKFLLSQYIENRIKNKKIDALKLIKDENFDYSYVNQMHRSLSLNREIRLIVELNFIKNCFKKFLIKFDED